MQFLLAAADGTIWNARRYRVAAPSIRIVPWAALASCWPLPQQLLPVSAAGGGRRRCWASSAEFFIICNSETTAVVSELLFHGRGLFGKAAGSFLRKFRRSGAPVRSTGAEQGVPDSFAKESSPPPAITAGSSARPRPRRGSAHRWRAGCARGSGGDLPAPRYLPAPPRRWSGSFSG